MLFIHPHNIFRAVVATKRTTYFRKGRPSRCSDNILKIAERQCMKVA